jgi:HEPN domain-containing protein
MPDRSGDWFAQAERNMAQGRESAAARRHEWACFAAQQAAEMAVKALHLKLGQEGSGHVVRRLFEELPPRVEVPAAWMDAARVLDAYYVPTRYPNGHSAGAPGEHYGELQSSEAIRYAGEVLEFCRVQMARAG